MRRVLRHLEHSGRRLWAVAEVFCGKPVRGLSLSSSVYVLAICCLCHIPMG